VALIKKKCPTIKYKPKQTSVKTDHMCMQIVLYNSGKQYGT